MVNEQASAALELAREVVASASRAPLVRGAIVDPRVPQASGMTLADQDSWRIDY